MGLKGIFLTPCISLNDFKVHNFQVEVKVLDVSYSECPPSVPLKIYKLYFLINDITTCIPAYLYPCNMSCPNHESTVYWCCLARACSPVRTQPQALWLFHHQIQGEMFHSKSLGNLNMIETVLLFYLLCMVDHWELFM